MYLSKELVLLKHLQKQDLINSELTGRLLGYPKCCTDFYMQLIKKTLNKIDFVMETYNNTKGKLDFRLNNVGEWANLKGSHNSLIDFCPCSYNCKNALSYAKKLHEFIRKNDITFADLIEHELKRPIIYNKSNQAYLLGNSENKTCKGAKLLTFQ